SVNVPSDRCLQVLDSRRILAPVERDLVHRLLGTVGPHRSHGDDLAQVLAEGDLLFVVQADPREQQHAIPFEGIEAFVRKRGGEYLLTTYGSPCTDAGRQRDKAATHAPVPSVSSTQPSGVGSTPWRAKIASISRRSFSAIDQPTAPTLSSTSRTVRQPTSAVLMSGFAVVQRRASCGRL